MRYSIDSNCSLMIIRLVSSNIWSITCHSLRNKSEPQTADPEAEIRSPYRGDQAMKVGLGSSLTWLQLM